MRVVVTDKIDRSQVDQVFPIEHGTTDTTRAEFDLPFGVYRVAMQAKAPHATCGDVEYFTVITDHNRTLNATLHPPGQVQSVVPTIIMGTAPFSFSYVQPTVLIFPKNTACNQQVGDPLQADIQMENDSDAYYALVYPGNSLAPQSYVVAVRMKDSHGDYHYIRVPLDVGIPSRWPSVGTFNVNEDVIDYVASKPEDTLLCPRLYKTITY